MAVNLKNATKEQLQALIKDIASNFYVSSDNEVQFSWQEDTPAQLKPENDAMFREAIKESGTGYYYTEDRYGH